MRCPPIQRFQRCALLGVALGLLAASPAHAKNHLWRFTEVFSNAAGTIQFIEMQECCGADEETEMSATSITSNTATYNFANDLAGPTGHRWLLVATQGFTHLPGAPAPDYIMPDRFFNPVGDTLRYRGVTDIIQFAAGGLPTNGIDSIQRDLQTGTTTVGVNSPINFAGQSGTVNAATAVPAAVPLVLTTMAIALAGIAVVRLRRRRHDESQVQSAGISAPYRSV
jgi:hypothetical protein